MRKYEFNDAIDYLEVDPLYLNEGLSYASKKGISAIRIKIISSPVGKKYDIDFSPFEGKYFIEKIIIGDDFKIGKVAAISKLYSLHKLTYLQVMQEFEIDLAFFSQLKSLYIKYSKYVKNINALVNVEDLLINSISESNCLFISVLNNLSMLLRINGNMESLEGLEQLKKLHKLLVSYSPKLINAQAINEMTSLESLHIEKCKQLTDFSFLKGNSHIEELFITELESLDFVRGMKKLKKIHFWDCKDGDLNPLIENPTIQTAFITKNKKHYTHTQEEINSLIKQRN